MALDTNLTAYWKFDEASGNATDVIGSLVASNQNSTPYAAGKINNGADLESGSSQHFTVADAAAIRVVNGWSVSVWIKPESLVNGYILNVRSGEDGWGLGINTSGNVLVYSGSGAFGNTTSAATISAGAWTHIVVYYNGSSTKLYINGVFDSTLSNANITNPNGTLYIGRKATGASDYFDGIIDELGIWSRELTYNDASKLYNSNNGSQYSFTNIGIAYGGSHGRNNGNSTSPSLAISGVPSGDNTILEVAILAEANGTNITVGPTYGGQTMTLIGSKVDTDDGSQNFWLYRLVNPSASGTIQLTLSTSTPWMLWAQSHTGVDQTTPIANAATGGNGGSITASPVNVQVTSDLAGSWQLLAAKADSGAAAIVITSGGVRREIGVGSPAINIMGDSNAQVANGASNTITYTYAGGGQKTGWISAMLRPAVTTPTFTPSPMMHHMQIAGGLM